jgi:hypothetical protein
MVVAGEFHGTAKLTGRHELPTPGARAAVAPRLSLRAELWDTKNAT